MSVCRKFTSEDLRSLSPEERLVSLESKIPVLIERIQAYGKLIEDFRGLKVVTDFLKQTVGIQNGNIDLLKKEDESCRNQVEEKAIKMIGALSTLERRFDEALKSQISTNNRFSDLINLQNETICQAVKGISELKVSFLSKSEFNHHEALLKDGIINAQADLTTYSSQMRELASSGNILKATGDTLVNEFQRINKDFDAVKSSISSITQYSVILKDDISALVSDKLSVFSDDLNNKISDISLNVTSQKEFIETSKTELLGRIHMLETNANSISLKANYDINKISLLEKKIENVYLLVKSRDLTK